VVQNIDTLAKSYQKYVYLTHTACILPHA